MDGKARVMKIVFMNKEADGRAGTAAGKSQNVCQNISDGGITRKNHHSVRSCLACLVFHANCTFSSATAAVSHVSSDVPI